jgi:2'-5' RNA ligase
MDPAPLILTLRFDEASFAFFDQQRRRYFPPERNFIPAHLTLFHHLPGEYVETIESDLAAIIRMQPQLTLQVTGLRSLGRGVAYTVNSSALTSLRSSLVTQWQDCLTPQDRQRHQPHVTVQNKVDPADAKALLEELSAAFMPFQATGVGLDLWWYRGGPWEAVQSFSFPQ